MRGEYFLWLTLLFSVPFVFDTTAVVDDARWPYEHRALYEASSNGTAIKGYRSKSIYILDDGVKHLIPDWITFLRYVPTFDRPPFPLLVFSASFEFSNWE